MAERASWTSSRKTQIYKVAFSPKVKLRLLVFKLEASVRPNLIAWSLHPFRNGFDAAEVKLRIGCLALQNPPLKIEGYLADRHAEEAGISGAPGELQEPLLWKPLRAEDFEIYEEIFRDRSMFQARAVRWKPIV